MSALEVVINLPFLASAVDEKGHRPAAYAQRHVTYHAKGMLLDGMQACMEAVMLPKKKSQNQLRGG